MERASYRSPAERGEEFDPDAGQGNGLTALPCSLALCPFAGEDHGLVPAGTYPNLEVFRERHVGFPIEFVARKTGLDVARLHAIEKGEAASMYELDRLAALYGIDDADQLAEEPIRLSEGDSLTVLALHTEFQETSNESRAAILRAGQAARDVVALRQLVEESIALAHMEAAGAAEFPLRETPPERLGLLAALATLAYSNGRIPRDRFARYLGVTPAADVERVMEFYGLRLPD